MATSTLQKPGYANTVTSGVITSDYTIRQQRMIMTPHAGQLYCSVNNGGSVFPTGRITLGNIAEKYRPINTVNLRVGASTGVNSYNNRDSGCVLALTGDIVCDITANDIKEISVCVMYPMA